MPLQLSQLIKRLNPEELAILLDRHGIVEQKPDPASIAATITQRQHLNSTLSELNQAQILIVRWLAQQHNLQASWDDFTEAIKNRMPEPWLQHCLNDLRLFGLVDYVAEPDSGWIATYAAVASAQPISRAVDLKSALGAMPTDLLQRMCERFAVKPTPTNNGKRIEAIGRCLSDHNFLVFLLASLTPGSLELFEWFLERGGIADHNALGKRLGNRYYDALAYVTRTVSSGRATNVSRPASPLIDLIECALVSGVSAYGNAWGYANYFAVPTEVATAYAGASIFDTAPLVPPQLQSSEPTKVHLPNLTTLLRDLFHLRAFIALGRAEWRQDGGPYARSLQTFSKLIGGPGKDYGATLWKMALEIPILVPSRERDNRYQAADLSGSRPDDVIRRLLGGWSVDRTGNYYDYYLPRDTHQRVLNTLVTVPRDTWLVRESFENVLFFFWPLVFDSTVRSAHKQIGDWSTLYATVLAGGVDKEGRELFQVQTAGMEIAFPGDQNAPPKLPDWDSSWVVQPDRTIIVPPNVHPDSILDLWSVADLVENQGASIFRISADSISAALNRGMTPDQITGLFRKYSRTPLPATIERLIRDQSERYGQVRVGPASSYLQVDDPEVLVEIVNNAQMFKVKIEIVAPTIAIVHGVDEGTTLSHLRRAGYLPISATAEPGKVPAENESGAQIKRTLQQAISEVRLVRVQWRDARVGAVQHDIEPEDFSDSTLLGYVAGTEDMYEIPLTIITSARLLTAQETSQYEI